MVRFCLLSHAALVVVVLMVGAGCSNYPTVPVDNRVAVGHGAIAASHLSPGSSILGSLVGGKHGTSGGYLIGADWSKLKLDAGRDAMAAVEKAEKQPATAADVAPSKTADLNEDGFITTDEVVAMQQAGLSQRQMVDRLEKSRQYLELTAEQQQYLKSHAVPDAVVGAMERIEIQADAQTASLQIGPEEPAPAGRGD
ncbi:MAG TPA: hypothetical protein VF669_21075 [Tepidisphaeraceae bacterium]|jgi:hypothetical protein